MPTVETPPNSASPPTPVKVRTGRYGELEEHELIHLLDSLDDERSKARFREAFYISVIFYLALAWFMLYGPRVIFHQPKLVSPVDVLKERDKELTYLNMPKDVSKALPKKPSKILSDQDHVAQTKTPTLDKKTLQQLEAMRRAGEPAKAAPTPAPTAPQQAAPAPQQPRQQAPTPLPQHAPQQQAMVDAPKPSERPSFNTPNQSAGDAIRQAAREAAANRGQGGDNGMNAPTSHQGINTGVEVLSDTQGVDFGPYLRRILGDLRRTWIPLLPIETQSPLLKQGETLIRFTIMPDGSLRAPALDGRSGDVAIDKAAWAAITGTPFPPLPKDFHGQNLELRIDFLVNKTPEQ